ncbi:MAG: hypothetical protein Q8N68_02665, partial [bacterium]|nr:hypothetical protein [bacterium]
MKNKTKKQKKSINVIRLMIVALLALGVGGGIYFWQHSFGEGSSHISGDQKVLAAEQNSGRFLLLNGDQNQVWYVYPGNGQRFYLGNAERGLAVLQ